MSTELPTAPAAPPGTGTPPAPAPTAPPTAVAPPWWRDSKNVALAGSLAFNVILLFLVLLGRGAGETARTPARSVDRLTLGEIHQITADLEKASSVLEPFLDARLDPLKKELKSQSETLAKVAEKVLGP